MNAIEYGSQNDPAIPVEIDVWVTDDRPRRQHRRSRPERPDPGRREPDLEAKLAGDQKPRGWGLFLIKHMVDAMEIVTEGATQTVILTLHLKGVDDANQPI